MENKEEINELTPKQYFTKLKGLKNKLLKEDIEKYKIISENLMKKAVALGQEYQISKLDFMNRCIEQEAKLLDIGIDTYVYRNAIMDYADNISDNNVKICYLEDYPREIPDEVANIVYELKQKKIFDRYLIIYTDYTHEVDEKIKKERDPILFGTFQNTKTENQRERTYTLYDRLYYIADWEDEYCDLTLVKMVSEMSKVGKNIEFKLNIPITADDVKHKLTEMSTKQKVTESREIWINEIKPKRKSFFAKIKSIFIKES